MPLGRPINKYEDNIKMDVKEVEHSVVGVGCIWLTKNRDQ